jgi:PAS domain S-box-containing protein
VSAKKTGEKGVRETRAGNGVFPLAGPARLKKAGRGARIVEAIGPEAEERYLAFIENAADGVVMVENGVHVYANRRFLDMFGFDDEREIVGKPLSALVHPEDLDRIAGYVGRDVSEEAPTRRKKSGAGARIYEFRGITKDGSVIHLEGSDTGIAFRGRAVAMCFVRDITRRKEAEESARRLNSKLQRMIRERTARLESTSKRLEQEVVERRNAEAALRASEARYRAIVQDQSELVCRFRPDTMLTFVNDAFCRFFGSSRDALMGRSFVPLLFGKTEAEMSGQTLEDFIPRTSTWSAETLLVQHDGQERMIQWTGRAIFDSDEKPVEFQGVGRDITEAKLAEGKRRAFEAALRESEEKFRVLAENTAAGVVIYRNNRLLYTNPAMSAITGFTRDELSKMTVLDTVDPSLREEARKWSRAVARGMSFSTKVETKPVTKSGEERWADATAGEVVIDNKPAFVCTLIDVTERKVVENTLRQRVKDIERLYETSRVLLQHIELGRIYEEICRIGVEQLGFRMVWVGLLEKGDSGVRPVAFHGDREERFFGEFSGFDRNPMTRGSVKQAVVSMQPSVTNSIKSDRGFVPWRKATLERGCRSFAAFPLIYDEEVFGVVAGYSQDEGHFTEERLRLYQSFTNLAANAVANARLLSSLSRQRDEIRAMASRLADVEESERKQLARELHDRVGQNLTALSINLNILGSRSKGRRPKDPRIDDCLSLLRDMTDSIRNVMGQLRPALLDEYGLLAALREYCGRFSRRFGIEVEVQGDGSGTGLPSASETAMFRIAQEALNNIAKHARAGRVRVTVTGDGKAVRMVVSDDGDGFVVDGAFDPASRRGWGITTMTERAEAIGGFCRIDSAPGKGTVVTVEVPR